jgi:hypothetical protein
MLSQLGQPEDNVQLQNKILEPSAITINPYILRDLGTSRISRGDKEDYALRLQIAMRLARSENPLKLRLAQNLLDDVYTELGLSRSENGFLIRALHHRGYTISSQAEASEAALRGQFYPPRGGRRF